MSILDEIGTRFEELIREGKQWAGRFVGNAYYVDNAAFGWLTSAANLVETVTQGRGTYAAQVQELLKHEHLKIGVPTQCVVKMVAILTTLQTDWAKGLVREIEYLISAENFDAFLDHAVQYHKAGHHRESGVLVSIVFEDALRNLPRSTGLLPMLTLTF